MEVTKTTKGKTTRLSVPDDVKSKILGDRCLIESKRHEVSASGTARIRRQGSHIDLTISVRMGCYAPEIEDATSVCIDIVRRKLDENHEDMVDCADSLAGVPSRKSVNRGSDKIKKNSRNEKKSAE